ncbi:MAG: DNA-protecting protein DprA [Cardiobacteriaceae bacterium]|nr:DNA-protecting protein DprA [Cardiobacteriaceae bacterium]
MNSEISLNTKAILLLTAPLLVGKNTPSSDLLTQTEYNKLAVHLLKLKRQPSDLISQAADDVIQNCQSVIDANRLRRLLDRGFLLSMALEHWQARSIWVISRADKNYPRRLKTLLRENAPALLYGCGDANLLEIGGLAVVGSRKVDTQLLKYAADVGHLCASVGQSLISGCAKGIDSAAMLQALENQGKAIAVLANNLEQTTIKYRKHIWDGNLLLVSSFDPNMGFNVGLAMARNKLIYALSDAALVVNADLNKGGTWAGAVEQLDKFKFIPVYLRSTGKSSPALDALQKKGALPWTNPESVQEFQQIFNVKNTSAKQPSLFSSIKEESSATETTLADDTKEIAAQNSPAEQLFDIVRQIMLELLKTPMKQKEIAQALNISPSQSKIWLQRLIEEGIVEKNKKSAYLLKGRI